MNPFQTILFLIFVLPIVMIKELWKLLTGKMTKNDKKKWLWRIPYILIAIFVILTIILWANGYR